MPAYTVKPTDPWSEARPFPSGYGFGAMETFTPSLHTLCSSA